METPNNIDSPKTPAEYARIFFSGMAMGAADIVPGVSGGTMAFILGIYEALLDGIKSFNLELIQTVLKGKLAEAMDAVPLRFLMTLGLGIVIAILTMANGLSYLLENEPQYLFAFFFGLVLASIIAIGAHIKEWAPAVIVGLVIGAIVAFIIAGLDPAGDDQHSTPVLFFSGMIAIMAMILPGISGSFILLLLGQYEYILNAVRDFNLQVIITVGVGAVIGLLGFSRVLSWLLHKYEQVTIAVLTGFMIGSLRKIYPFREEPDVTGLEPDIAEKMIEEFTKPVMPDFASTEFWVALALCLVGFAIVTGLDHMQSKSNPVMRLFSR